MPLSLQAFIVVVVLVAVLVAVVIVAALIFKYGASHSRSISSSPCTRLLGPAPSPTVPLPVPLWVQSPVARQHRARLRELLMCVCLLLRVASACLRKADWGVEVMDAPAVDTLRSFCVSQVQLCADAGFIPL